MPAYHDSTLHGTIHAGITHKERSENNTKRSQSQTRPMHQQRTKPGSSQTGSRVRAGNPMSAQGARPLGCRSTPKIRAAARAAPEDR